ncbi:HlyD family secretion protein [Rhizobium sp. Root482]|uniref:HlyD family secretion protein n=1 Tax=Rhizobium sp. Root482 TaxID=1736543 RepID=UPI0006F519CC|nr:HlyD family secretion protein [Rhizobium sp. Root482]KQY22519.1 hemolysin D [Rhizobium sp. Root482]
MVELSRNHTLEVVPRPQVEKVADQPSASVVDGKGAGHTIKRGIIALVVLVGAAYAADYSYDYWMVGRFVEMTDNAYVKADFTAVAPKIPGYIKEVLVRDNETVKAGQVLARIDDRDFQTALRQAKADVKASQAVIANIDAQIALQESVILQATASLDVSKASYKYAHLDAVRSVRLISSGAGSQSRAEQSQSLREQASAAVERDEAGLVAARNKVPVLATQRDQAVAQRDKAAAALAQAELNLSYTAIVSAVDGTVGARTIRVGQLVAAGTQLMAVVPLDAVYVVANYKETQLTDIRPGQSAEIEVDGLPGLKIRGHVDSISPASGLDFSLIPPDNATGNFTKIVQRIPVKIAIDDTGVIGALRSGMSVESSIDTQADGSL